MEDRDTKNINLENLPEDSMVDAETKVYVDSKVDKIYTLLKGLNYKFDGKFDGLSQKFDGLSQGLRAEMSGLRDGLDKKMDGLNYKFDGLSQKFDGLRAEMSGMEKKMDAVLTNIALFRDLYEKSQEMYGQLLNELRYLRNQRDKKTGFTPQ